MSHLRSILPYYRPYRKGLVLGLVLVVLAQGFSLVSPYLIKLAIDALADPDVTAGRIAGYAAVIVGAALLGGAARFGMRDLLNGISRRMEVDLRSDFFRHLLRLDASFYDRVRTGDLMSRATNDTLAVRQAAGPAVMYTVNTAVGFVIALGFMLHLSPRLALLAMIPMLLLPPVVLGFGQAIHRRFERIQEQYSTLSNLVQENLTGVRIVRAYVQEDDQAERFDALNAEYRSRNMKLARASGLLHPLLGLLTGVALVIVLWVGGREVIDGRMSTGDYVAFFFYLGFLVWPMIALGWVVNLFQRGAASMARLNQILHTEPALRPPARPAPGRGSTRGSTRGPTRGTTRGPAYEPIRGLSGKVEFRDVSFRYPGTERWVLRDVSFSASPGETVAVVGATGSGKSTMISLIPRLYDPDKGEVLLDGVPLTEYHPAELRVAMGVVPQDPFLFSDTILENLALGITERTGGAGTAPGPRSGEGLEADLENVSAMDIEETVLEAAAVAQLHESITGFPRGYKTMLGERGINLSGGQKQRATLARALARDPRVLILDDALSAVDTHTEARILADLREAMRGRTSFIISHRVSAVMHADQILVLDEGRIVERGTHAGLLALGGTYARLLRRQMLEQDLEAEQAPAAAGD